LFSYTSGAVAYVRHTFWDTGYYNVKVLTILNDDSGKASDWSAPAGTRVLPNGFALPPTVRARLAAVVGPAVSNTHADSNVFLVKA
jgi:hypothetical protein